MTTSELVRLQRRIRVLTKTLEEARRVFGSASIHADRGKSYHAPDGDEPNTAAHEGFVRIEAETQLMETACAKALWPKLKPVRRTVKP